MSNIVTYDNVTDKIVEIRQLKVILDSDVAELYGVGTREVNQAVKNNIAYLNYKYIITIYGDYRYKICKKIAIYSVLIL